MVGVGLHNMNFRFNVVEYIKKLRNAGASQEIAEVQAQEMEYILEQTRQETKQAFDNKELATKSDLEIVRGDLEKVKLELQKDIAQGIASTKIQTLIWIGLNTAFMFGVMAKGFHWW